MILKTLIMGIMTFYLIGCNVVEKNTRLSTFEVYFFESSLEISESNMSLVFIDGKLFDIDNHEIKDAKSILKGEVGVNEVTLSLFVNTNPKFNKNGYTFYSLLKEIQREMKKRKWSARINVFPNEDSETNE